MGAFDDFHEAIYFPLCGWPTKGTGSELSDNLPRCLLTGQVFVGSSDKNSPVGIWEFRLAVLKGYRLFGNLFRRSDILFHL